MRFMMFVATDPEAEPFDPAFDNVEEWVDKLDASGKRIMLTAATTMPAFGRTTSTYHSAHARSLLLNNGT